MTVGVRDDGWPTVRIRRDIRVTPELVDHLNDLLGAGRHDDDTDAST